MAKYQEAGTRHPTIGQVFGLSARPGGPKGPANLGWLAYGRGCAEREACAKKRLLTAVIKNMKDVTRLWFEWKLAQKTLAIWQILNMYCLVLHVLQLWAGCLANIRADTSVSGSARLIPSDSTTCPRLDSDRFGPTGQRGFLLWVEDLHGHVNDLYKLSKATC